MLRAQPKLARDFFGELIKDSQAPRAAFLGERERWLRSLELEGREEQLFEFEMLLRGIERYFNLHNLPLDPKRPVVVRDFHEELYDVRDALNEGIRVARRLLAPGADQKLVFRRYLESQLVDDRFRRELLDDELSQESPPESLFLLRESFESLRTVLDHLLKLDVCGFALYTEVGNLTVREIVLNRYFRPFRPLEFRLEYDRIKSVPILEALRAVPEADRRLFTVAFLALFRLLHYLSYVSPEEKGPSAPRARVILALIRSESVSLVGYLRGELAIRVAQKRHKTMAIRVARDIQREVERVHALLWGDEAAGTVTPFQIAVDLTQLFRAQLVHLARAVAPGLEGLDFDAWVSRVDMAERLRTDLWAFAELCRKADLALRDTDHPTAAAALAHLREYAAYFQDVSYQLLRYGDYEPLDRFTGILLELEEPPAGPVARLRLAEDCGLFAELAATLESAVGRRSDLARRKLDKQRAQALVDRFSGA
jgi:hypothetical protein